MLTYRQTDIRRKKKKKKSRRIGDFARFARSVNKEYQGYKSTKNECLIEIWTNNQWEIFLNFYERALM